MSFLFWFCIIALLYVYGGYLALLRVISYFMKQANEEPRDGHPNLPVVSLIVAAYNEEKTIVNRIENLLEQVYPKDKLEIIVASDGSTDNTAEIARRYERNGVRVLHFEKNRGRAAVHNDAVKVANGEIIIFTDASARFDKSFLKEIIRDFENPIVGCACGKLLFETNEMGVSVAEGFYWRIETKIRKIENDIGIFASGTGACLAIRKTLFCFLDPREDIDDSLPLHVVMSGYKVSFLQRALAYDIPNSSIQSEIRARARMTAKGIIGVMKRWGWKGWIKHPFVSWGLLSHKILRWFTPFFMLCAFVVNLFLLDKGLFYRVTFAGQTAFYNLAIVGLIADLFERRIPVASIISSFCVANIGIAIGVIRGLIGKAPAAYNMRE